MRDREPERERESRKMHTCARAPRKLSEESWCDAQPVVAREGTYQAGVRLVADGQLVIVIEVPPEQVIGGLADVAKVS